MEYNSKCMKLNNIENMDAGIILSVVAKGLPLQVCLAK